MAEEGGLSNIGTGGSLLLSAGVSAEGDGLSDIGTLDGTMWTGLVPNCGRAAAAAIERAEFGCSMVLVL